MSRWTSHTSRSFRRLISSISPSKPASSSPHRRLQYMSDLHLEIGQQYTSFDFPAKAPFLILGGDIGRLIDYEGYLTFLQRQITRFERVFFVLGNHEFYGMSYSDGVEKARELESESSLEGKVVLLHQNRYDIDTGDAEPGITVLGCVLWSQIAAESADRIAMAVSDFKQIHDWTVEMHNSQHVSDVSWLRSELGRVREEQKRTREQKNRNEGGESAKSEQAARRVVVIATHHAPLIQGTASPKHKGSAYNSAFATDICIGTTWGSPVGTWIFGHTHWTTDLTAKNGVRVVSNQRGYVFPGNARPIDQGVEELPPENTFDASRYIQF